MSQVREIVCTFVRERFVFLSDDEQTRTIIAEAEDQATGKLLTIRGISSEKELKSGLPYRFWGRWNQHPKYGDQFAFDAFVAEMPATEHAIITYLTEKCRGIGRGIGRRIYEAFGDKSIEVVRSQPELVAEKVPGVSEKIAQEAAESLSANVLIERATVDLMGLLHGRQIPKGAFRDILKDYGSAAAAVIRRNPYLLMRYRGIGFLKTDKLYAEFGHNQSRLKRQALCCWYAVASSRGGDTWIPLSNCRAGLAKNVSGVNANFDKAMLLATRAKMLRVVKHQGQMLVAEEAKAANEDRCARLVVEAMSETESLWRDAPIDSFTSLSDHQKQELRKAICGVGNIGILAGSPGTGKTYTVAALVKWLIQEYGQEKIAVCAPTGKAAVRVAEAMNKAGVSLPARTIHSLLGVASAEGGGWTFEHNEKKSLPHQFIIVDEGSMKDLSLNCSLLAARAKNCHVLIVGDTNQLAPVGHGAPLRDMILAGVPCGKLTEIQRNAGRIVKACAEIRDTRRFTCSPKVDPIDQQGEFPENLGLLKAETPVETMQKLTALYSTIVSKGQLDPIWDVQTICAVNKKGMLSRKSLNTKLQDLLNPQGDRVAGCPFRVGDKIINTKNASFKSAKPEDVDYDTGKPKDVPVANGEQGEVVQIDPGKLLVRLTAPDRLITVPRGKADEEDAGDGDGDGDSAGDDDAEGGGEKAGTGTGCAWEMAYACSCHKYQGSECKVVIVILDDSAAAMRVGTRNWLFTAISRGKLLTMMIGKMITTLQMCSRDGLNRRTLLAEKIREWLPEEVKQRMAAAGDGYVTRQVAAECRPSGLDEWLDQVLVGVVDGPEELELELEI